MSENRIKNIIFDYGGVIMDIRPMAYVEEMIRMGAGNMMQMHENFMAEKIYRKFETGVISPDEFRDRVRKYLPNHASNDSIDHAWNLILGEIPRHRIEYLRTLGQRYRLFLLSNTNAIHYEYYQRYAREVVGLPSLDSLFEKAYFSYQIGLYKPDHDIFEYVLNDSGLVAAETAFIDDMKENADAAAACGLQGIHLVDGRDITSLNL